MLLLLTILGSCSSSDDGEDLFKEVLDIAGYTFPGHTNGDGYCNMGDTFGGKASFIFGKDNSLSVSYGVYTSLESKILEQLDKKDIETNALSNIRKEVVIDSEGNASWVILADWSLRTFTCSFDKSTSNDSTYFLNFYVRWNENTNAGITTSRLTKEQVAKLKKLFYVSPDSKEYKEALKKKGLGVKTALIKQYSTESIEDQLDKLSHPLDFDDLKFELKGNQKPIDFETLNKKLLASIQVYFESLKPDDFQQIDALPLWVGSELKLSNSVVPVVKFSSFEKQEFELYTANGFSLNELEKLNPDVFIFYTTVLKPAVAKWLKENKPQPSEDLDAKEFLFKLSPNQSDTFSLIYRDLGEPSYIPPTSTTAANPNGPAAPTVPRGDYSINDPDGYTNLRATPGGKIIRKVYENETFDIIQPGEPYSKIKLTDGTVGYMHNSRISAALQ
ncbi:MAG: hypothetical protein RLZ47_251 [Bacteroidota bacterium]|jgi:hypothetical protein